MNFLEPISLEADERLGTLFIGWNDGHNSEHNIVRLRRLCPCAECKGEWGLPGKLDANPELTPQQTELGDMRPVGRYALMPIWADGHNSGIYTFDYLRANCECAACIERVR